MKLNSLLVLAALIGSASAFAVVVVVPSSSVSARTTLTRQYMFSGAGAGIPSEDNPEKYNEMVQSAKQMGMSVDEYKLGVSARLRFNQEIDAARVQGGSPSTVLVERDGNNPPKFLDITITDAGKAQGKEALSKELVKALKGASDASRNARNEAQKQMMAYIGEEMKKLQ